MTLAAINSVRPGWRRGTPTSYDYTQNGLLIQLDAIDNAVANGVRYHDANAVTWKDLIGDGSFRYYGVPIWDDRSVLTEGGWWGISLDLGMGNDYTFEFVMINEYRIGYQFERGVDGCVCADGNATYFGFSTFGVANDSRLNPYWSPWTAQRVSESRSLVVRCDAGHGTFIIDGDLSTVYKTDNMGSDNGTNNYTIGRRYRSAFRMYAYRVYNRPLTDVEILHNYYVDTVRFNLS